MTPRVWLLFLKKITDTYAVHFAVARIAGCWVFSLLPLANGSQPVNT